jgi:hypothetical protein
MTMDFAYRPPTARLLRMLRSRRFWGFFALGLVACLILLMIAIRIDQALFRRDAELLIGTIRKFQVGVTTPLQAQQMLEHWPQAAKPGGNCNHKCGIGITLQDSFRRHNDFFISHRRLMSVYILLGGTLAEVRTSMQFVNGVFRSHSIGVYIYVAPYQDATKVWLEYALIGAANIREEPERPGRPQQPPDPLHPTYWVRPTAGCEGCFIVEATFAPEANSSDVNRLMQFDLSCLNRWWHPCRTQADIMPPAWKQFLRDEAQR